MASSSGRAVAYLRVSTQDQADSGLGLERPARLAAIDMLRTGDARICAKRDRLGRDVDLRIVTDDLWHAAHARLARVRSTLTLADHRRRDVARRDYDSNYLLTGHVRCTVCGGSITVVSRQHGKRRVYFYGCLANWKKGAPVCPNDLVLPIEKVNQAVLAAIATDTLQPAVVTAIIDRHLERLLPVNISNRVDALRQHLRGIDAWIANLTAAIEQGGDRRT
jgi:site-specific DNA recombinase